MLYEVRESSDTMESGGDKITNVGPISWAYRTVKDPKTNTDFGQYGEMLEQMRRDANWHLSD
jgi:hypothetical protein